MNDNKKFSIKEYRYSIPVYIYMKRETLYSDISKRKKEQRKKWQTKYLA
jgi:mitogen-activated protein kinase 15